MRLLIAGGGTGGHLFPGVALAEELRARDSEAPILFVGTDKGIEARVLPELGWNLELIDITGIKTKGALGAVRALLRIPRALLQSRRIIKKFCPDAVVGVGGYASGPLVLMARLMGVPTAVLEQNSIPGLANKILGKFVRAVFLCFDVTRRYFADSKIIMSGNPIRRDIVKALQAGEDPNTAEARLFIFGGSQGAVAVNDLVVAAMGELKQRGLTPTVVHQTGTATLEKIQQDYAKLGINADCRSFINDMAAEYRQADLIIARSGATTVAELGVVGKPAILIPYPFAADNHQEINAKEMADAGAAAMLRQQDLDARTLADVIADKLEHPQALTTMGNAMKALGRPQAAATIIDWCESQLRKG